MTFPSILGYIIEVSKTKEKGKKKMFITFETTETTETTVDITRVQSWDTESLVRFSAEQLGTDYVDFSKPSKIAKGDVTEIDWKPLINRYRTEMVVLRRPARKFTVSI